MAKTFTPWFLGLFFLLANIVPHLADNATLPTIFILGDSTADVGTNSFIKGSQAIANFPHNGVDYPNGIPTGRFSNGFNSADHIAKLLGFKRSPPPYLFLLKQTSGHHKLLHRGVNFASGGSGLLDTTGSNLSIVTLSDQIGQFTALRNNLTEVIGQESTETTLSKALFFISVGSNDIFDYFNTSSTVPIEKFIDSLMSAYTTHIEALYNLGARKFGIISVAPVGCCPANRLVPKNLRDKDGCFEAMNNVALAFQSALNTLLYNISSQLSEMKYSLGNAYNMTIDVIHNFPDSKFDNVDTACCGTGILHAQGPCNKTAALCPDRRKYLFWDSFHPTQKAACLAAKTLFYGPPTYVSPINFSQLVNEN
ncbi:GDSL esterase/lipase At5g55050-like [Olea europaea var. sylvestris]|uniref:GDSL esterase/lipase At5g55050-like n=1 Tax=Olea europaea var. sylvestris TaxID=158386 RepID=UPI000C1D2315|nr:GDSL esterase/lipase At5g55050-like [Olea europaea var. sylvestris]